MLAQYTDAFSDFLKTVKDGWVEVTTVKNQQAGASPSQYTQQPVAVDATGKPIVYVQQGQAGAIQSWLLANWLLVLLVIVLVILAYKYKWI